MTISKTLSGGAAIFAIVWRHRARTRVRYVLPLLLTLAQMYHKSTDSVHQRISRRACRASARRWIRWNQSMGAINSAQRMCAPVRKEMSLAHRAGLRW